MPEIGGYLPFPAREPLIYSQRSGGLSGAITIAVSRVEAVEGVEGEDMLIAQERRCTLIFACCQAWPAGLERLAKKAAFGEGRGGGGGGYASSPGTRRRLIFAMLSNTGSRHHGGGGNASGCAKRSAAITASLKRRFVGTSEKLTTAT